MPPMSEPPIQNIGSVDVTGKRIDGGVDLFIVASSRLDGAPDTQRLLLAKLKSYLEQLNTPEFQAEFDHPGAEKTVIIIACQQEPDPIIRELVKRAQPWVQENNARLE